MWKDKSMKYDNKDGDSRGSGKNNILCNNCGKYGHIFNECRNSITSYGIILYWDGEGVGEGGSDSTKRKYLMIRRKDSFGYIDFMRGKYYLNNPLQIQNLINEMSISEKESLLTNEFHQLWDKLWIYSPNKEHFYGEEQKTKSKFELLKPDLYEKIRSSPTNWKETEWEFPKGKRNVNEKDMECAIREFEEETGISVKSIDLLENVFPFEENFIGSNRKPYKNKYYLARYQSNPKQPMDNLGFQPSEVSEMAWKTYDECMHSIRDYHFEKKHVLTCVHHLLNNMQTASTPSYPS